MRVPNSSGTRPPRLAVPEGACDCHLHIVSAAHLPPGTDASAYGGMELDDYRMLQDRLGIRRAVIVQAKAHGTDNAATVDAVSRLGPNGRGVAVLRPDAGDATLARLDAQGIRGLRFSVWKASDAVTSVDMIEPLAARLHALGWHAQINMSAEQIVEHAALLRRIPCAIVFDHMARIPPAAGPRHPAFRIVSELLGRGDVWVKLSGAYLDSVAGGPDYSDMTELARAFASAAPDRAVWGSDWPHVTERHKPDDAGLLDLLLEWLPDDVARKRVLTDNPAMLYGFGQP